MRFNPRGDLIRYENDYGTAYIPAKQVNVIKKNFARGVPYPQVSPMYPISRAELAYIITH